uniref:F-box protein n=1 Tax=Solanum tuberosum TaxID=4113 RepID=M1D3C6_SOLTU
MRCVFTKSGLDISRCHDFETDIHFRRDFGRSLKRICYDFICDYGISSCRSWSEEKIIP